jgi:AbrB family looped-hinge helix DNA binding protein
MATLTVGREGEILLPDQIRDRFGLRPGDTVRLIETRNGVLLILPSDEPMSPELAAELAEWQALSAETWEMFPYEDAET